MIPKIILLVFPILLVVLPMLAYKNSKPMMMNIWLCMAYNENGRKMAANILTIAVIILHLVYYAAYPTDYGIMLSTLLVFYLLSTKRGVKLLQWFRKCKTALHIGAALCVIICAIPHLFPTALSLALILETACFFPADGLERFYEDHVNESDADKIFVDAYFK